MISKILQTLLLFSAFSVSAVANAVVYNATNAQSDIWHSGGHDHALWLPGLLPANDWNIADSNPGTFDFSNGEAHFFGSVTNDDGTSTADFEFFFVESQTGTPKRELIDEAYSDFVPPGPIDTSTNGDWKYFDFDIRDGKGSTFTGTGGDVDSLVYNMTQRGSGGVKGQLGTGANGKNILFGFSAWLNWALTPASAPPELASLIPLEQCPANGIAKVCGKGDININLSPVPVPAAFWLFGTALVGFIGFSRRRTI